MKMIKFLMIGLCFINMSYALQSEHMVWEKVPLAVELPLQQERLVQFPQSIKIIDQNIPATLDVLKVKGSLYLKAQAGFNRARLIVQLVPDGEVIILNLKANEHFNNTTPIEILTDDPKREQHLSNSHYEYNAIQLTRFAIQALYSPQRVQQIPNGVYRSPMQTQKTITLFYGASIEAHPIASWRGGPLHVTAIELKNLLNKPIVVKPESLIGQWQTASFFPGNRLPARNKHETITLFLVSDRPFHEAFNQQARYSR